MKLLSAIILICAATSNASEWTQWRGPSRDGKIPETSWPATLSQDNLKKVWTNKIAEGYSSPIISETLVFTVETKAKKSEVVRAFDRKTGEQVWESDWEGSMKVPFFAAKNGSWVRCTPAFDGAHLYVGGMKDVLVCLDAAVGKEKWRVDFVESEGTPVPGFGFVSSPLIDGDALYVQAGSAIKRLNKSTGETKWSSLKDDRAMYGSAFSSPVIATIQGKRQLVVQARELLAGLDLENGDVLWQYKVKAFRGMNILTPTVIGNRIFTSTYGGGTSMFEIDADMAVSKIWVHKIDGYMSSPVVIDGHIYLHARDQKFHCFKAESGEHLWESKSKYGEYWSIVANGIRMLALDESGRLILIEANPVKFDKKSHVKITGKPAWAHVGVCDREIFVRDLEGITKFEWVD
jgi:outer membrane protein assembly factor BamB